MKLKLFCLACCLAASASNANPKNSNKQLFDFNWRFSLGDHPTASQIEFDDSNWRLLDVPHDLSIEHPRDKENPTSGGGSFAYSGVAWYRNHFISTKDSKNIKTFIYFEGIYRNSEVWINGHYLGIWPYGYSSFFYDLTDYLKPPGSQNIVAVKVNTSEQMNSRWYTGAGIYRHVWLITCSKAYIEEWGVFAQTQTATKEEARINIDINLKNEYPVRKDCEIIYSLLDSNQKTVSTASKKLQIAENNSAKVSYILDVENPTLWSINNPYLYSLKIELRENGKTLDMETVPCGIRTFRFDSEKGFILNGEHIKLKGTNNHHDGGPLGSACLDYTFERQLTILKDLGCNALRMSHNPPSPAILDAADRLGFVVIDEIFDEWEKPKTKHGYSPHFYTWYERDIENWIKRDRNHPSIVAWSIGNEVIEQYDTLKGPEIGKLILSAAKKYDTSRPFTIGSDGIPVVNVSGLGDMLELVGYNYQESMYEEDHKKFPNRVIYGSETVMYPYHPGDCWQMHSYEEWLANFNKDYVAGEFLWTGFDYLGEAGLGEVVKRCDRPHHSPWWPTHSASCGLADICGFEKPAYFFRKAIWKKEPLVYIAVETDSSAKEWNNSFFWGWPKLEAHWNHDKEGDTLAVHVYTNISEIELRLNGKSLGTQKWDFQKQAFPIWNVPYTAGKLEAIGTLPDGNKVMCTLQTAKKPSIIRLVADKSELKANKQDLTYIKAYLLDENGIQVPFAENVIEFEVEGAGFLNSVGNGNVKSNTPYKGKKIEAHLGKCLAIIQSGDKKGKIKVTARSKDLPQASIEIIAK